MANYREIWMWVGGGDWGMEMTAGRVGVCGALEKVDFPAKCTIWMTVGMCGSSNSIRQWWVYSLIWWVFLLEWWVRL
jgi:hypothetical protein